MRTESERKNLEAERDALATNLGGQCLRNTGLIDERDALAVRVLAAGFYSAQELYMEYLGQKAKLAKADAAILQATRLADRVVRAYGFSEEARDLHTAITEYQKGE